MSKSAVHGHTTHGIGVLKRALNTLGRRSIDKRTRLGKALDAWRLELIADLGGDQQVSTQQKALVDLCVRSKLLLDSLDVWLLEQRSLVNVRKKSVYPALLSRTQLSDSLARYLGQLGLEKKSKKVLSLSDYLGNGKAASAQSNSSKETSSTKDGTSPGPPGTPVIQGENQPQPGPQAPPQEG